MEMEWCMLRRELNAALKSVDDLGGHRLVDKTIATVSTQTHCELNNAERLKMRRLREEGNAMNDLLVTVYRQLEKEKVEKMGIENQCKIKDEKILALRNTAMALECENELLMEETRRLERDLMLLQRQQQQLGNDKVVKTQNPKMASDMDLVERKSQPLMTSLQQKCREFDACRLKWQERESTFLSERKAMSESVQNVSTENRRLEDRVQRLLEDNAGLSEQVRVSETRALSLEATLAELRRDRRRSEDVSFVFEQKVAEQNSLYEAKIGFMQDEIDATIEAVNANKESEVREVKERYTLLFNEKAEELAAVNTEFEKRGKQLKVAQSRILDLEEREKELQALLNKTQSCMDERYAGSLETLRQELTLTQTNADTVESEMANLRSEYHALQDSYKSSVQAFQTKLLDITRLVRGEETSSDPVTMDAEMAKDDGVESKLSKGELEKTSKRRRKGKRRRGRQ